eukprot:gene296-1061_t
MKGMVHYEASNKILERLQHRTKVQKYHNHVKTEAARSRSMSPAPSREQSKVDDPKLEKKREKSPIRHCSMTYEPSATLINKDKTLGSPKAKFKNLPHAGYFPFSNMIVEGATGNDGIIDKNDVDNVDPDQLRKYAEWQDLQKGKVVCPADRLSIRMSPRGKKGVQNMEEAVPIKEDNNIGKKKKRKDPSFENFTNALQQFFTAEEELQKVIKEKTDEQKNQQNPDGEDSDESATGSDKIADRQEERDMWETLANQGEIKAPAMALSDKMKKLHKAAKSAFDEVQQQKLKESFKKIEKVELSPQELEDKLLKEEQGRYLVVGNAVSRGKPEELFGNIAAKEPRHVKKMPDGLEKWLNQIPDSGKRELVVECPSPRDGELVYEDEALTARSVAPYLINKTLEEAVLETTEIVAEHLEALKEKLDSQPEIDQFKRVAEALDEVEQQDPQAALVKKKVEEALEGVETDDDIKKRESRLSTQAVLNSIHVHGNPKDNEFRYDIRDVVNNGMPQPRPSVKPQLAVKTGEYEANGLQPWVRVSTEVEEAGVKREGIYYWNRDTNETTWTNPCPGIELELTEFDGQSEAADQFDENAILGPAEPEAETSGYDTSDQQQTTTETETDTDLETRLKKPGTNRTYI